MIHCLSAQRLRCGMLCGSTSDGSRANSAYAAGPVNFFEHTNTLSRVNLQTRRSDCCLLQHKCFSAGARKLNWCISTASLSQIECGANLIWLGTCDYLCTRDRQSAAQYQGSSSLASDHFCIWANQTQDRQILYNGQRPLAGPWVSHCGRIYVYISLLSWVFSHCKFTSGSRFCVVIIGQLH